MAYLLPTYNYGAVRVVNHVVTHAPHQSTADRAETASTHHDHVSMLVLGRVNYYFSWLKAEYRLDCTGNLQDIRLIIIADVNVQVILTVICMNHPI